jgi:plastocyanin
MTALVLNPRKLIAVAFSVVAVAGCGGDALATRPNADTSALYWSLTLDHRAVTLATTPPYDTIRLIATPRNPSGAALAGLGSVTFTSSDLARLRVSADGVVQALAVGTGALVVATLQAGNVTHADTVFIDITPNPTPRPLGSLSIHPVPPDSAKVAAVSGKQLTVQALDVDDNPMAGLLVEFRSSDPTTATVDRQTGFVAGKRPGHVLIVASSTVYGNTRADTLPFTIGEQVSYWVHVDRAHSVGATPATGFTPSEVTVGSGATIMWQWTPDLPATDVTFEDPTNVAESAGLGPLHLGASGPGNIPAPDGCTSAVDPFSAFRNCLKARTFPVPGVYRYHSTLTGAAGEITVVDEHAPPGP